MADDPTDAATGGPLLVDEKGRPFDASVAEAYKSAIQKKNEMKPAIKSGEPRLFFFSLFGYFFKQFLMYA